MEDLNTILGRYETSELERPGRVKAKSAQDIYDECWVRVSNMLNDRAGLPSTRPEAKKHMRFAAREITMARNKKEAEINLDNVERLLGAERQCFYVLREVVDELTVDANELARQAAAGHPHKRRMQVILPRLRFVVETLKRKAKELRANDAAAPKAPQKPQGAEK